MARSIVQLGCTAIGKLCTAGIFLGQCVYLPVMSYGACARIQQNQFAYSNLSTLKWTQPFCYVAPVPNLCSAKTSFVKCQPLLLHYRAVLRNATPSGFQQALSKLFRQPPRIGDQWWEQ